MNKQVDKLSYQFDAYSGEDRWVSYHAQLREILASAPHSVLEVGAGAGVIGAYLKRDGVIYTSVDVADDLSADVQGDVRALPFEDNSFDVVCAFEVLEHIPFDDVLGALSELARVSKKNVIISVPHFGPAIKFLLKIPFFSEICFACKIPYPRKHVFNGQHYWELGKQGFSVSRFRTLLSQSFIIRKEFIPFGNQYHHFFILEKTL